MGLGSEANYVKVLQIPRPAAKYLQILVMIAASVFVGAPAVAQVQHSPPASAQPEVINSFLDQVKSELAIYHLSPIFVSEGEKVGYIINPDTSTLIASADNCFSDLKPRKDPTNLPGFTFQSERGLAIALGIGDVASINGEAAEGQSFVLDYEDVQVERVSTFDFRRKLKSGEPECEKIRTFIDASVIDPTSTSLGSLKKGQKNSKLQERAPTEVARSPILHDIGTIVSDRPPPLLIGTLFTGHRLIKVVAKNKLNGQAKLSIWAHLKEALGLGANFAVDGDEDLSNTFTIRAKDVVPIALAPAFVVINARKLDSGLTEYKMAGVDGDASVIFAESASTLEHESFKKVLAEITTIDSKGVSSSIDGFLSVDPTTWKFKIRPTSERSAIAKLESTYNIAPNPYKVLYMPNFKMSD